MDVMDFFTTKRLGKYTHTAFANRIRNILERNMDVFVGAAEPTMENFLAYCTIRELNRTPGSAKRTTEVIVQVLADEQLRLRDA